MIKAIGLALLLVSFASVSSAGPLTTLICKFDPKLDRKCATPASAPEIDAASTVAGLTLLMGALVVLRGRRTQNTDR
jgi:hypothetical protein